MAEATTVELRVEEGADRLDTWLAAALGRSRARAQALIREGRVQVDGRAARPSQPLRGGERVRVEEPPPPPLDLRPEAMDLPLLYLDEHLIVLDKPVDLVVHPARGHAEGTLVHGLLHLLAEAGGDEERPGIVHRLDKGTSGIMVVARHPRAHERLAEVFARHALERRYLALVWGRPPEDSGVVEAPLGRHPRDRLRFCVVPAGGKAALTRWWRRAGACLPVPGARRGGELSLMECKLETGRTHQVRVHMQHLGHPLLGDPLYGGRPAIPPALRPLLDGLDHQLLHAWHLGIPHPEDGRWLSFFRPPPADFLAVAAAAGIELPTPPMGYSPQLEAP